MTPETARFLARALRTRWAVETLLTNTMFETIFPDHDEMSLADTYDEVLVSLAKTYVHEQRIINRIVAEAVDE